MTIPRNRPGGRGAAAESSVCQAPARPQRGGYGISARNRHLSARHLP